MAKLASKSFAFPEIGAGDFREVMKSQDEAFKKLSDASDAIDFNNPKASLKGAILQWPRADGYAVYIVTEDKPLTIAHVPYGDAWSVEPALIRGLTRADVVQQLRQTKAMHDLFNKKG